MWRSRPKADPDGQPDADTADPRRSGRPDWADSFTMAADVGLLGICVFVSLLPVLTAGAGVATASVALEHWMTHRRWPDFFELAGTFRRALLPGVLATVAAIAVAVGLTFDIVGLGTGAVPGGRPALVAVIVLAAGVAALATLTVVEVGRHEGRHWLRALRAAWRAAYTRPVILPALAGMLVVPVMLSWMIPLTVLLMPGFALFAAHVVDRRLRPRDEG
ncbi:MAG TPA: hypothetical protein VK453_05785 [Micromonosporaceae bacterium]|nr:hypothetical protein [Micromonosporaceae bacterium]